MVAEIAGGLVRGGAAGRLGLLAAAAASAAAASVFTVSVQLDENFTVSDPKNLFPYLKNRQLRKRPHLIIIRKTIKDRQK